MKKIIKGKVNACLERIMNKQINEWINEWMKNEKNGYMDEWMIVGTDERISKCGEYVNEWSDLHWLTSQHFFISIKINQDQPNQRHEDSSNRPPVLHIGCLTPALGRGDPSRGPRCDSAWENWTRSRCIVWLLGKSQESTSLSQAK